MGGQLKVFGKVKSYLGKVENMWEIKSLFNVYGLFGICLYTLLSFGQIMLSTVKNSTPT